MSETDIARPVVAWLADLGWDVYQEVQCVRGGPRADIVATRGAVVRVVEVKATLGMAVIAQAWNWRHSGWAHQVCVAVPTRRRDASAALGAEICRERGIGLLIVGTSVEEIEGPATVRRAPRAQELRGALAHEHKTCAEAGSQGGYWTPYQGTCRNLLDYVRRNPGCALADAIREIKHHYRSFASAQGAIAGWVRAGKVRGVRLEEGRPLRLWPTTA